MPTHLEPPTSKLPSPVGERAQAQKTKIWFLTAEGGRNVFFLLPLLLSMLPYLGDSGRTSTWQSGSLPYEFLRPAQNATILYVPAPAPFYLSPPPIRPGKYFFFSPLRGQKPLPPWPMAAHSLLVADATPTYVG